MNTNIPEKHSYPQDPAPESITRLLTSAADELHADTISALHLARNKALSRQPRSKPALALDGIHGIRWHMPHFAHQWWYATILLLALLVSVIGYWHHERERETSHLDIAILTDDLPMEIFVDR